ncbi:MAG: biopolymer transporter ExbD [Sediminibacterium sp.]|nr:biopolymer transporter ExbD [Sediminibacterium sp.]
MGRSKIPRKSTNIDMTAMCDVAFLLLSFFIMATKFKPAEAIPVVPPSSVSSKVAPSKDICLITVDQNGKVFLGIDDKAMRALLGDEIKKTQNIDFKTSDFASKEFWGCSFSQLPSLLALPKDKVKGENLPGIPAKDSAHNELIEWMKLVKQVYLGKTLNIIFKGDGGVKYDVFNNVLESFRKNDLDRFQMVTNPTSVPEGTELWKKFRANKSEAEASTGGEN